MDRTTKAPPGRENGDRGATDQRSDGGPRGAVVSLSVPAPADVSDELGSLADLMRRPGLLSEPPEREGD